MYSTKRPLLVPPGWWQAAILVMLIACTILGILAYLRAGREKFCPSFDELLSAIDRKAEQLLAGPGCIHLVPYYGSSRSYEYLPPRAWVAPGTDILDGVDPGCGS